MNLMKNTSINRFSFLTTPNKIITLSVSMLLTATMPYAAHAWGVAGGSGSGTSGDERPLFSANELSLDLSGSFIAPESKIENLFKTDIRHGTWGGDVGINYFFLRNVGIDADANMSAIHALRYRGSRGASSGSCWATACAISCLVLARKV